MFGFRNTFIYDAQGRPCYKTWSMGAFVDKTTGHLKRADEQLMSTLTLEPRLEMDYRDRRIILGQADGEAMPAVTVMRADIDYNRHMNNANYVRVAMELLPADFLVTGLRVEYRAAARCGDVLVPTVYRPEPDVVLVALAIGETVAAIVEFTQ